MLIYSANRLLRSIIEDRHAGIYIKLYFIYTIVKLISSIHNDHLVGKMFCLSVLECEGKYSGTQNANVRPNVLAHSESVRPNVLAHRVRM